MQEVLKGKSTLFLSLDGVFNQLNFKTMGDQHGNFLMDERNFSGKIISFRNV